jgi:hypothetical protein
VFLVPAGLSLGSAAAKQHIGADIMRVLLRTNHCDVCLMLSALLTVLTHSACRFVRWQWLQCMMDGNQGVLLLSPLPLQRKSRA